MMKNHLRMFCIVLAASLFGVIANLAAAEQPSDWQGGMGPGMMGGYGHGCDMGPGMSGGYGMGHGMMGGSFRELGLSDEQRSKVTKIRQEMRTRQWAVMGQMMDAQDRLQELYDADNQDAAAINKQYKVIEDLRSQMVDNSVDAHNRINSILTKEQREKFRGWGHGYGPMMR
jgi:Spy/CpxP family protein refolding chaperone